MRYLNKFWDRLISWKWLLFTFLAFLYGGMMRSSLLAESSLNQIPINTWDLIISSLSDTSFIIYIVLPFFLFFSAKLIMQEWDYSLLIRKRSFSRWMFYTITELSFLLLIMQVLWLLVTCLLTIGIPYETSWSQGALSSLLMRNHSVYAMRNLSISPWIAVILQMALSSLWLLAYYVIIATAYIFRPNMITIVFMNIFLFISSILAFKSIPTDLNWLRIESYLLLGYGDLNLGSFLWSFSILILFVGVCFSFVSLWQARTFNNIKTFIKEYYPIIIYSFICLLGLFLSSMPEEQVKTIGDSFYLNFYGLSKDGFGLLVYLYFSIVFLGLMYLFQIYLSYILDGRLYYQIIRYKSLYRWFGQIMKKTIVALLGVLLLLFGATVIIGLSKSYSLNFHIRLAPEIAQGHLIYHFFVNGFLQVINYLLIAFIIRWTWQEAGPNLLALGGLMVIGLPQINVYKIFPAALNSMGYLTGNLKDMVWITIVLVLYIIIELAIIFYSFSKNKIPN